MRNRKFYCVMDKSSEFLFLSLLFEKKGKYVDNNWKNYFAMLCFCQ